MRLLWASCRNARERRETYVWPCAHAPCQGSPAAAQTQVAVWHLRACVVCSPRLLYPTRFDVAPPCSADTPSKPVDQPMWTLDAGPCASGVGLAAPPCHQGWHDQDGYESASHHQQAV